LRHPMQSAGHVGSPARADTPHPSGFEAALPLLLTILGLDAGERAT
jgi:hypothetical protein